MELRPMTMADADMMLGWKNYPETREFAIVSHAEIRREDHLRWLEKNLQFFQVINDNQGAIRVQDSEVSVWVDRAFWGQGVATEAIKLVSQTGFTAKIVAGNVASIRCFIKCGYRPISYQDGYFIFKCTT